jgi:hypothetical protein
MSCRRWWTLWTPHLLHWIDLNRRCMLTVAGGLNRAGTLVAWVALLCSTASAVTQCIWCSTTCHWCYTLGLTTLCCMTKISADSWCSRAHCTGLTAASCSLLHLVRAGHIYTGSHIEAAALRSRALVIRTQQFGRGTGKKPKAAADSRSQALLAAAKRGTGTTGSAAEGATQAPGGSSLIRESAYSTEADLQAQLSCNEAVSLDTSVKN